MYICLRTLCNRSASALVVADQTFMVGPGVSPVPVKLVSQIVAGKYVDLCDLLPANLQVKEPEPQLQLFNFHAAGASVHSPSSNDSSDWEPTGSSGSIVVCKSCNGALHFTSLHLPLHTLLLLLFWFASCSSLSNFVA